MKIPLSNAVQYAEIASAIAVIITLIFVSVQLGQNTAALKEANHQGHTDFAQDLGVWILDPAFADTVLRANKSADDLTEVERLQYGEWFGGRLALCESVFQTRMNGTLSEKMWIPWSNYCVDILSGATAREMWNEIKPHYEKGFAAWLDEILMGAKEAG